jgi:hypothetical protein
MQKPMITLALVATTLLAAGARAQTQASAPVVTPSSPAPTVTAPAPATSAAATSAAAPAANQVIYTPRLPTAAELSNAAAAQGVAVERIEQTSSQITVSYRYSNGQTNVVSYQALPAGSASAPAPQQTVVQSAPPAVVYAPPPPRVIYYDEPVYYPYPGYYRPYYPPVSLSFGFGYRHGGGYRHWR